MKKSILFLGALVSFGSFADTEITCRSQKYMMKATFNKLGNPIHINYGINNQENYQADVELQQYYRTSRSLNMQFIVDGLPSRFELITSRDKKNIFRGRIYFDKEKNGQEAVCREIKKM